MKICYSLIVASALLSSTAQAFPPAPAHEIYGMVRNESGRPLDAGEGTILLNSGSTEITRTPSDPIIGIGLNYSLKVPMDSGIFAGIYQVSALKPNLPFTIRVVINGINHVPIQMQGNIWQIGKPGLRTRLDLLLGVDSDGDGLPDSWEQLMIDSDATGQLRTLADVKPGDDLDGDRLTNFEEFIIGSYALDQADGLKLEIISIANGMAHLQFVSVSGRSYHIKSSSDLKTWTAAPFALTPDGIRSTYLRADDTTYLDIYAPIGDAKALSYRLYAE